DDGIHITHLDGVYCIVYLHSIHRRRYRLLVSSAYADRRESNNKNEHPAELLLPFLERLAPSLKYAFLNGNQSVTVPPLEHNLLIESQFNSNEQTSNQQRETNNEKQIIIFCDGVDGFNNPFFKNLPYSRMKGEALIVSIPNLPRKNIYKQGFNIVPWKEDLWWVGSSYEWQFENLEPTEAFRKKMETQLNNFLKIPYTVINHIAAERPANMERRPFVGLHPVHKHIGILNGMGTKGCSLAPYFAYELTEYLVNQKPINPLANVQRFSKILSR
nr:FAD-dependent oxidoreductase [Chitinophagaceae bacterium]